MKFYGFYFHLNQIAEIIPLEIFFFVATLGICLLLGIHHIHWAPVTHPAGLVLNILRILHENQIKLLL